MDTHKRTADEAGFASDPPNKAARMEDVMDKLDPSVRVRLRSLFDSGLVLQSDLDPRSLELLSEFDASDALEVLEQYAGADFTSVRNKAAYLVGVIRHQSHRIRPSLAPQVRSRLDALFSSGQLKEGDLDQRCLDSLAKVPPNVALATIDKFASRNMSEVRNPSALFASTLKMMQSDKQLSRGGGGPGGPGSSRGPPHQHQHQQQQQQPPPQVMYAGGASSSYGAAALPPPMAGMQQQPQLLQPVSLGPGGQVVYIAAGPGQPARPVQLAPPGTFLPPGAVPAALPGGPGIIMAPRGGGLAPGGGLGPPGGAGGYLPPPPKPELAGRHRGAQQSALGVRVHEFHDLSPFAAYVHEAPAIKLQELWDDGNELVGMLDDKAWELLADLPAGEAVAAIDAVAQRLGQPQGEEVRNVNALLMSQVRRITNGRFGGDTRRHNHDRERDPRERDRYRSSKDSSSYRDRDSSYERGGRSQQQQQQQQGGGFSRGPGIHLLPPEQRAVAEELCNRCAPYIRPEHFDEGVVATLGRMPEADGRAVLEELGANQLEGVRNMPSYIMGICRRYKPGGGRR